MGQGALLESRNTAGRTSLIYAAMNNHLDVLVELLESGSEIDAADQDGRTSLMWAARYGHYQVLK